MMPEPGDRRLARPADRGRMRASHAERDQVVDTLKDAFVQGRLTKAEFDARVAEALSARTHADLSLLTADIPAATPASRPPGRPARERRAANKTIRSGTRVIAVTTLVTAGADAFLTNIPALTVLVWTFTMIWFGVVLLAVSVMLESRHQRRSGNELPPGSGRGGLPPRRAVHPDPAGRPRQDDHGLPYVAEASRSPFPILRPSLSPF